MAEDQGEKTIRATPHKREEAKKEGDLPRSREFANFVSLIIATSFLFLFGGLGAQMLQNLMRKHLSRLSDYRLSISDVETLFWEMAGDAALMLAPFLLLLMVVAIVFSIAWQGGWHTTFKPFSFKVNRFNPAKGLKRILFSSQALLGLVRSILVVLIISFIGWQSLEEAAPLLGSLQMMPLQLALNFTFGIIFSALFKIGFIFIILAFIDLAWSKYIFEKRLKMTHKELQDEIKNTEGDPKIKRRVRTVQYQMHRRRMMASVPKADVVVTNPVHLAIALQYDVERSAAPEVVAKGAGYLAEKIKEIARDSKVPIVENPPLAQTLYKSCEVGDIIPPDLYKTVAEVLAYVYRLRGKVPA